jgi:hypothetical protein
MNNQKLFFIFFLVLIKGINNRLNGFSITNQNNTLRCCTAYDQTQSTSLFSCTILNSFLQLNQSSNLITKNQSDGCDSKLTYFLKNHNLENFFLADLRAKGHSFFLDDEFGLDLFTNYSDSNSTNFYMNILGMAGVDLKFDFNKHDFLEKCNDFCFEKIIINFEHSKMNLLDNKRIYNDKCDFDLIKNLAGNQNIDRSIKLFGDKVYFNNMKYFQSTCSYFFMNSQITNLYFYDLINSPVDQNILGFTDLYSNGNLFNLNCEINNVLFEIYRVNINYELINRQIFKNTQVISFCGVIDRIAINFDFFNTFNHLNNIQFSLVNFHEFFYKNPKWLSNYLIDNKFDDFSKDSNFKYIYFIQENIENFNELNRFSEITFDYFEYKESDFCFFSNYPVNKTIFYILLSSYEHTRCTCTMAYLVQNLRTNDLTKKLTLNYYKLPDVSNMNSIYRECIQKMNDNEFKDFIKKCDFNQKLENCKLNKPRNSYFSLNMYDLVEYSKIFKFIFAIIGMPVLSTIGITLNILVIITLIKRKSTLRQTTNSQSKTELIFDYILLKTIVNLIVCLINCFNFTIKCVGRRSFYCSPLFGYFSDERIYLDSILFNFVLFSLKLLSSLISLMFSFTRFLVIFRKKGCLSRIVFKIKPLYYVLIIGIFSFMLNYNRIYLNDMLLYHYKTDNEEYIESYMKPRFMKIFSQFYIINIISFLFNNLIVVILIISIDSLLILGIKIIKSTVNRNSESTETYLDKLIIYNGFLLFFLKLADTFSNSIWAYHNLVSNLRFCFSRSLEDNFCINMIEISEFFSDFAYTFDFILLYKFNIQFRNSFKTIYKI